MKSDLYEPLTINQRYEGGTEFPSNKPEVDFYGSKKKCCICVPIRIGVYLMGLLTLALTFYEFGIRISLKLTDEPTMIYCTFTDMKMLLLLFAFSTYLYFFRFDTYKSRIRLRRAIIILLIWDMMNFIMALVFLINYDQTKSV